MFYKFLYIKKPNYKEIKIIEHHYFFGVLDGGILYQSYPFILTLPPDTTSLSRRFTADAFSLFCVGGIEPFTLSSLTMFLCLLAFQISFPYQKGEWLMENQTIYDCHL